MLDNVFDNGNLLPGVRDADLDGGAVVEDGPHGRCDTCGAPCDPDGCTADRTHSIASDGAASDEMDHEETDAELAERMASFREAMVFKCNLVRAKYRAKEEAEREQEPKSQSEKLEETQADLKYVLNRINEMKERQNKTLQIIGQMWKAWQCNQSDVVGKLLAEVNTEISDVASGLSHLTPAFLEATHA